jgi:aspartyl-tRNA(Asn)/glutamyl-tRNA(Gln) amidotransferase subunit C
MTDKIDKQQVQKVAKLARLQISNEETEQFSDQLSEIIKYIEKMDKLDTDSVDPLAHCLDIHNNFRKDVPQESLGTEKTLENAPERDEDFFKVPKIIGDSPS